VANSVEERAAIRLQNVCEYLIILASERTDLETGPPVYGTFALPSYVTQVTPTELPRTVFVQPEEFEAIRQLIHRKAEQRGGTGREFSAAWHGRLAIFLFLDLGDRTHIRVSELMPASPFIR
jgi:hypothetical protein